MQFELQEGSPRVNEDGTAEVVYVSRDECWLLTVSRHLDSPVGGPDTLTLRAIMGPESNPLGGHDTEGITTTHLKALPLKQARQLLDTVRVERSAREVIAAIPQDFETPLAYARLAEAIVRLSGLKINNPVALIARFKEGGTPDRTARDRWGMRVKRARSKGYLAEARLTPESEPQPVLTGAALDLLAG